MSWQTQTEPCRLQCPWNGTEMCVRTLLSYECLQTHHISLGVACGLKVVYQPNGLPPCISTCGVIDWETGHAQAPWEPLPATEASTTLARDEVAC